jgi:hypothetical protein
MKLYSSIRKTLFLLSAGLCSIGPAIAEIQVVGEWDVELRESAKPWVFKSDGTYEWYSHRGTWRLDGDTIVCTELYLEEFVETYKWTGRKYTDNIYADVPGEVGISLKPRFFTRPVESSKTTAKVEAQIKQNTERDLKDSMARQHKETREQQERAIRGSQQARAEDERVNGMSEDNFLKRVKELESGKQPPAGIPAARRMNFLFFAALYEKAGKGVSVARVVVDKVELSDGKESLLESQFRRQIKSQYKSSYNTWCIHVVPTTSAAIVYSFTMDNGRVKGIDVVEGSSQAAAERNMELRARNFNRKNLEVIKRWPTASDLQSEGGG